MELDNLIKELQAAKEKYGNVEIHSYNGEDRSSNKLVISIFSDDVEIYENENYDAKIGDENYINVLRDIEEAVDKKFPQSKEEYFEIIEKAIKGGK